MQSHQDQPTFHLFDQSGWVSKRIAKTPAHSSETPSATSALFLSPLRPLHPHGHNKQVNDPNGPLWHRGTYHMFFQNVEGTSWTW